MGKQDAGTDLTDLDLEINGRPHLLYHVSVKWLFCKNQRTHSMSHLLLGDNVISGHHMSIDCDSHSQKKNKKINKTKKKSKQKQKRENGDGRKLYQNTIIIIANTYGGGIRYIGEISMKLE